MEGGGEEEREAVTGGWVAHLGHDFKDGDELVGNVGEFIASAFD